MLGWATNYDTISNFENIVKGGILLKIAHRLLLEIDGLLEPSQFHVFTVFVGNVTIRVVI